MKFAYTATKDGKPANGVTEAANKEAVVASLIKQGYHPIVVKETGGGGGGGIGFIDKLLGGKKVKLKDLVIFTRQLSVMINAGVPITRALNTLGGQTESKYFQTVIAGITKDVSSGISLGDAFAKYPNVFSEVYTNMVKAGEAGGILDEILKRLASQVEQDASMRKKIKSASAYPVVILGITVIAFFGVMIFIIPKIGKIITDLEGPGAKLPVYTEAMLKISGFMQHNAVIVIAVAVIGTFSIRRYIKTPSGRYQFHSLLLKAPIFKTLVLKICIARFSRTFASLMSSGVSVLDALEVTGGAIGNKVIEAELKNAAIQVRNGKQLSEPLSQSKHFPPIVGQMLAIGEETGQIDTILVKVADFYEEEVSAMIDGLSSLIEPLMIIVLGAIVGVIAASVMGPIAGLSKNLGNN
jgi:type IV pilus assembly protein PilC